MKRNHSCLLTAILCSILFCACNNGTETTATAAEDSLQRKAVFDSMRICTELEPEEKAAGVSGLFWYQGQTVRVKFLGGSPFVQAKVQEYAHQWSQYSSIKFEFVTTGGADIRISFAQGKGSFSLIGKNAVTNSINLETNRVYASRTGPTMNFGWFSDNTPDMEFSRTVLHEFGHALGLIHEHQQPLADIPWNRPVVYEYYMSTQGWTADQVNTNIFNRYRSRSTQYSAYDKLSIMHYAIPAVLLTDPSYASDWNYVLSETDKNFIRTFHQTPYVPKKENDQSRNDHGGGPGPR